MALYGLRPVPEIQFADFIFPAYDQIVNELAKFRYRSGGEYPAPIVIRTPVGGGIRGGHYHSQSPGGALHPHAGLKVVCPSNPYDAKGLLLVGDPRRRSGASSSSRSASTAPPRATCPRATTRSRSARPRSCARAGHVTVIAWGAMLYTAIEAAEKARRPGHRREVIDLRTLCRSTSTRSSRS